MPGKISRIFFADDDVDDHFIFKGVMKDVYPGAAISSFYHCGELISSLKDENNPLPDVIFLDHNMPGNDGNECLKLLKSMARILHIPVVMYSTSDRLEDIDNSKKNGAYKYVVKPFGFNQVRERLKEVICELENS